MIRLKAKNKAKGETEWKDKEDEKIEGEEWSDGEVIKGKDKRGQRIKLRKLETREWKGNRGKAQGKEGKDEKKNRHVLDAWSDHNTRHVSTAIRCDKEGLTPPRHIPATS